MATPADAGLFTPTFVVSTIGALVAASGLALAWRRYREESLRRGDVLTRANEAIAVLEGLVIACIVGTDKSFAAEANKRLASFAFDSAILVERVGCSFAINPIRP